MAQINQSIKFNKIKKILALATGLLTELLLSSLLQKLLLPELISREDPRAGPRPHS